MINVQSNLNMINFAVELLCDVIFFCIIELNYWFHILRKIYISFLQLIGEYVYCWSRLYGNMIGDLGVQHLSQDGLRHCPNLTELRQVIYVSDQY